MAQNLETLPVSTADDPRWAAVLARDAAADGVFVYSVRTTGIYCRPSCPARGARPENVRFHASADEAEVAGFRPCKRCKPDRLVSPASNAARIAELCRFIEASEHLPSLRELAEHAGLSPYYLHRLFKRVTGVTPRAFAVARRAERVRAELAQSDSVTAAIYDAGYNSNGRFYETAARELGMNPARYRLGGLGAEIRFAVGQCALGAVLVAASARGVCAISLGDDPDALVRQLQDRFPRATLIGGDAQFERLVAQVAGFVEAPRLGLDLPLDVRGSLFQRRVWDALQAIPAGTTVTYKELAERIGAPQSARAVAGACAANPLAVAIPCHRVVRTDGDLSGYRWGVERKRALLERESR